METIVVGYNDSDAARAALDWAIQHAMRTDSELLVAYVASSIAELAVWSKVISAAGTFWP